MTMVPESTTVVVVDDHDLFREGLKEILHASDGIKVVGEAGDSATAVEVVGERRPHVVLLDIEIPGEEVTQTVRRMRRASPDTQVIILSMYEGPHFLRSLLRVGIRGYLLKSVSRHELISMVRGARAGDDRVLLSVSRASLAQLEGETAQGVLSHREWEVLQLAAEAHSNTQIARRLGLTEGTVKRHLSNIYGKLGAVSRLDAVNKASAAALISVPKQRSG
ncbi:response regulator transcription factor [Actinomadura sp. WMMB 499]|uniref:response regulator n=1 Tax=Actinomadura sp. WMMB 499 TaxID=1219491 RepID=UPI001243ECB5|nr:response regulator transcription factor [Actinomadura sp. WMMB 499]QFG20269.1 response regulator transcription factor [Actinomadura sp. WMMB 499]